MISMITNLLLQVKWFQIWKCISRRKLMVH